MVEMREASSIIAGASERSLVLIDEIGRGTATLDGLALAQAILEWMVVKSKARVLFATHFHELTLLEAHYPSVKNLSVGSEDRGKTIVFTHRIVEGAASRSYGLEVAERAGLPAGLMRRARALHSELMVKEDSVKEKSPQLSLFQEVDQALPIAMEDAPDLLRGRLRSLDIDTIAPRDALTLLFELQQQVFNDQEK
jgi:DNA mismatch repair protein MutS